MALDIYGLDLIVASNIGTLKHVKYNSNPNKKKQHVAQLQNVKDLRKGEGIVHMTWADSDQTKFIVGRKNNTIQTYDLIAEEFIDSKSVDFGEGKICNIATFQDVVIVGGDSGIVKIWKANTNSDEFSLNVGGRIEKMKHCSYNTNIIATGGKENDLRLWDFEKNTCIFHAKNVANDWLQLRVPIWISDICFLPENSGSLVATCSRYGTIRLYDARAQRRPVCNVEFEGQAVSCISLGHCDRHVIAGTGRGLMNSVDLRNNGKLDKSYKGAVGAITEINCHKPRNIVISTSLDRHLRIHDVDKKNIILKQYLTSRLTCFLLRTAESSIKFEDSENITIKQEIEESEIKEETSSDQEYNDLFDNMETIQEAADIAKRKKKSKLKKRKVEDKDEFKPSIIEQLNAPKKSKVEEKQEKDDEVDIDVSIKKLLRSTEKIKRQLLLQKKKKKSKSLFYK